MSKRSSPPKRRTIGANNPLDKLGDDPLGFIPGAAPAPREDGPPAQEARPARAPLKQISVRIPSDLYKRLKMAVARSGESQQHYLTRMLNLHLDATGAPPDQ